MPLIVVGETDMIKQFKVTFSFLKIIFFFDSSTSLIVANDYDVGCTSNSQPVARVPLNVL